VELAGNDLNLLLHELDKLCALATVVAALERAGATFENEASPTGQPMALTKTDLMTAGLSGTPDAARRQRLLAWLELPATRLLEVVNATVTPEEWKTLLTRLDT